MAGYRPKSLEELNSLYDKSINIKNEIDKKASDLEVKQEIYTPAASAASSQTAQKQAITEETPAEEITGLVDDFIKNFGAPVPVKRVRPVAPSTVKAVSSAKNDEVKAPVKQSSPVQAYPDRPKLIRSSERNDLFEDYKKVMDDEDDDDFSFHRRARRRGKKLFERKSASAQEEISENAVADSVAEEAAEAADTVAFSDEAAVEDDIPETLENIDAVIEKVLGKSAEKAEEEVQQESAEAVYEISDEQSDEEQEIGYEDEDETIFEPVAEVEEGASAETAEEPAFEQEQEDEYEEPSYADESEPVEADEAENEDYDKTVDEYLPLAEEAYDCDEADAGDEAVAVKSYKLKNILLAVLLLVLVCATAVSAVKAFAGINSDIPVSGKYHLYSADTKYIQGDIKKGDLVVVVHEAVEEGKVFAYKKSDGQYSFAKLDGVLNDDTLIADNDGQKSIVFKNTVRGTIYKTIPAIGTIAAVIASSYLSIIGVLILLAVILLLVLVFAFRDKNKKSRKKVYEQVEIYSDESQYDDVEGDFSYLVDGENENDYDAYRDGYAADDEAAYEPEAYKYEPDEYVNS